MRCTGDKPQQAGVRQACCHIAKQMVSRRDSQIPAATWQTLPSAHAGTKSDQSTSLTTSVQVHARHQQAARLACLHAPLILPLQHTAAAPAG